jgi:hypothetical protein
MRSPRLALAPAAMAGVNNQRRSDQTIPNLPARSSAFHWLAPYFLSAPCQQCNTNP